MGLFDRLRGKRHPDPSDLLEAELLVPIAGDPPLELGETVLQDETTFAFRALRDDAGGLPIFVGFTSKQALQASIPEGAAYVGLRGRDLFQAVLDNQAAGVVIDHGSASAQAFSRAEVEDVLDPVRVSIPAGSEMLIGLPATPPPDGFLDEIRTACAHEPEIVAAYTFQTMVVAPGEEPHLVLGLEVASGSEEPDRRIGESLRPGDWGYEYVDVSVLEGDLLETVRETGTPFFTRG